MQKQRMEAMEEAKRGISSIVGGKLRIRWALLSEVPRNADVLFQAGDQVQ